MFINTAYYIVDGTKKSRLPQADGFIKKEKTFLLIINRKVT